MRGNRYSARQHRNEESQLSSPAAIRERAEGVQKALARWRKPLG